MEFEELIDLQYLYPLIGVLACAFLVFIFGFQSAVQPPSFDYFDDPKKTTGKAKRKSKEKKVHATENGGLKNGSVPIKVVKETKSPKVESKKVNKEDSKKSKKIEPVSKKQQKTPKTVPSNNKKKVADKIVKQKIEDPVDDGWTEQISRREKKIRKNEIKVTEIVETGKKVLTEVNIESNKDLKVKSKSKKQVAEKKSDSSVKETETKKSLDSNKENVGVENIQVPVDSKSKKKKKKDEEVKLLNEKNVESSKLNVAEVASAEKATKAKSESNNVENIKPKSSSEDKKEEIKEEKNNEKAGLAFDELGDIKEDVSKQKKKKKVRRDH